MRTLTSSSIRIPIILLGTMGMSAAQAQVFLNQPAVAGGGIMRSSQLWVDPAGQNDLDGDAICYQGFVLNSASTIRSIDWWGSGYCDKGFTVEFWKQDPGTVAYQPWAVFRTTIATPAATRTITNFSAVAEGGINHYSTTFSQPVSLAANDASNVRWFVAVIGLTSVPYGPWTWAQGNSGTGTFWWIRGGGNGGGDRYTNLPDSRAVVLTGQPVPEPTTTAGLLVSAAALIRRRRRRN